MYTEAMITVADVEKTSQWFQSLFDLKSIHGGEYFDRLVNSSGIPIILFNSGGDEAQIKDLTIYINVDDVNKVKERAINMRIPIVRSVDFNELSHQSEVEFIAPGGIKVIACKK